MNNYIKQKLFSEGLVSSHVLGPRSSHMKLTLFKARLWVALSKPTCSQGNREMLGTELGLSAQAKHVLTY